MAASADLTICHVILHSCVRVWKVIAAQNQDGRVTPFAYNAIFAREHPNWEPAVVFRMFVGENQTLVFPQIQKAVRQIAKWVDAFHVHNTPDVFAPIIREAVGKDAKIFYDVHDLLSYQTGNQALRVLEDASADAADHIFTISQDYRDLLRERYPHKNVTFYQSKLPRSWYPKIVETPEHEGIVYQGGISQKPGHHRNVFDYWEKMRTPLTLFPSITVEDGTYEIPMNVTLMRPVDIFSLYRTMAGYEAGFVGTQNPDPHFDGAMPNKFWEYLSCGIPVIAANCPAVADWLDCHPGIGVVANAPEEVVPALRRIRKDASRKNVAKIRDQFSMNEEIARYVHPIYEDVIR